MNDLSKIQRRLENLGIAPNEAKVYLLLIQHHELRVQEIVQLTKLPRSTVYENLKTLFDRGLTEEIVEDSFKKIRPYPIGVMKHSIDEELQLLQKRADNLVEVEKTLDSMSPNATTTSTVVRYYKGVSGARQLLWNTLKAKDVVYVYSAWGRGHYVGIRFYRNFVIESKARDIKEMVLINSKDKVLSSIRQHYGSPDGRTKIEDIRTLSPSDVQIVGETFMYGNVYSQLYLKSQEINGFEIESKAFVETQRSIFETLWREAKPLSELIKPSDLRL